MVNNKNEHTIAVPEEAVVRKIHVIRNQKVMLDEDLAGLYEVETRRLNEQVKRNKERFPEDFMFQLTGAEFESLISQIATSSWGGRRKMPYAFTEHGVLMLSSVLNSPRAIQVNILIVRVYTKLRQLLNDHTELLSKLEKLEHRVTGHDANFDMLFAYLKELTPTTPSTRKIGFRIKDD